MKAISVLMCVSLTMLLGAGCSAGARIVRSGPTGGEMAMWGPTMPAARHGREVLIAQCPRGYSVSASGEGLGLGHEAATLPEAPATASADRDARVVRFQCKHDGAVLASR